MYRRSGIIGGRREEWYETKDFTTATKEQAAADAIRYAEDMELGHRGYWEPCKLEKVTP